MKKLFTNVKTLLATLVVLPMAMATAQYTGSYQMASFGYTYGNVPAGANVSDANAAYDKWKTEYVTSSQGCGYRRVIFDYYSGGLGATDKSETVSEGIAYGMLLAAYRGDRSLFDDLWNYYKSKRNSNGVMNWKIKNCGVIGANGATDAELDVAMSLIIASEQWQTDAYLTDAKSLIKIIREKEFQGNNLKPGDQFGGSNLVNPSYFSPAYYRVFKTYDGNDSFWDAAAAAGYATIAGSPGASKGLVPDWSTAAGAYSSEAGAYTDQGKSFFFDAVRTPFRSAIDYLWHQSPSALTHLNKFNTWAMSAHNNNIVNVGSKYDMNGNKTQTYHNATFSACFAVAAMVGGSASQAYLNSGYTDLKNTNAGYGEYFNATFKAIGMFVMTGNFYLPKQCTNKPELGADKSLCKASTASLSTTAVNGATYLWKKDGAVVTGSSNTLTANAAGVYELTMTSGGCAARDKVTVFGATLTADFIAVAGPGNLTVTDNTLGGASNYTYTITPPTGAATIKTTPGFVLSSLTNGQYTIKLDVNNTGFGCTGTSTITKKVTVGNGVGIAVDDFAEANERKIYAYSGGTRIIPIEKTWCSKADADANAKKECPKFPSCGNAILDFNGTGAASQYDSWGLSFDQAAGAPYNLSTIPYVAIRAYATAPIDMYVKLNQKTATYDFANGSSVSNKISLTTEPQIFNIDFSTLLAGWDNTGQKNMTLAAWNAVTGMAINPFDDGTQRINAAYRGVVTIDYVIIGAKGIPAPTFNIKKDASGYTDYGVYLKDYYPNDPKYVDCTPTTAGPACYGSVPDWKKDVVLCGATVPLVANTCTATSIRWFKDGGLLGTGATYSAAAAGKYVVELSNVGGITRDTVTVTSRTPVANFSFTQDNFDVKFANTSSGGFDTWVWSFGATDNWSDGALGVKQTTSWDPTYYGYTKEGPFSVKLTVKDTLCNKTATVTKVVTVVCNGPTGLKVTGPTKTAFCSGEKATYAITVPEYTSTIAWFTPKNTTFAYTKDSTQIEVTYGLNSSGPITAEAYGSCLAKKSVSLIDVTVTDPVVANFVISDQIDDKVFFAQTSTNAESLAWTFGAPNASTNASTDATPVVSFKGTGTFNVCLTAKNTTCNTTNKFCKNVVISIIGLSKGSELSAKFVAFPNPVMGGNVEFSNTINNVVVMDALGNQVASFSSINKLDVSSYGAGIYFVKSDEGTARIVVQ